MLTKGIALTAILGLSAGNGLFALDFGDVEIHGFASMGYLKSDSNNYLGQSKQGSFEFNEYGLNFRAELDDRTTFGLQLFSRDLGRLGNNEIEIDWGYLDHSFDDKIGVRIGRVKLPFGFYGEYQDLDAVRTSILMPQGVYNLGFRDTTVGIDGISVYGNLPASSAGDFDYNIYFGNLPVKDDGSVAQAFADIGLDGFSSDIKYAFGGSLVWNTPVEGLRFAYSYQRMQDWGVSGEAITEVPAGPGSYLEVHTPVELNAEQFVIQTLSAEYTYHDWVFAGEYQIYDGEFVSPLINRDVNWGAWYVQTTYRLNEKWEFGTYYMEFLEDREDSDGSESTPDFNGWQKDLTFSVRYDVSESWNLKAELHMIDGVALLRGADNPDGASEDKWNMIAVKSTVTFQEHVTLLMGKTVCQMWSRMLGQ